MCRPKHVEKLRNIGIINSTTRLHLVGSFYEFFFREYDMEICFNTGKYAARLMELVIKQHFCNSKCADSTSRKVEDSIPSGVIGIFH